MSRSGPPAAPAATTSANPGRTLPGLALVLPAGLALLIGYVVPSLLTLWLSFTDYNILTEADWTGFENYRRIVEDERPLGFWFAVSLALVPLVVLLLVAPLLAWAAAQSGRPVRLATRLALTLPLVCLAPAAVAVAWAADQSSRFWLADHPRRLGDPLTAPWSLRAIFWVSMFGLVCALGVTVYLSVLRGRSPSRSVWPAVLTLHGLVVLATVAVALQSFTYPFAITGGGPEGATITPMLNVYEVGFRRSQMGYASAHAMALLVPLMVLGVAAALLVIQTRLRVEMADRRRPAGETLRWDGVRVGTLVAAGVGLVIVLGLAWYGLSPWLSGLGRIGPGVDASRAVAILVNTWLPPLLSAVVGVGLAALAGFGIGALRPFGRRSELLLLPFAPWLFVGIGPLFLSKYLLTQQLGLLNSFIGAIPPIWVVVPALFLFTVLFKGLESQRQAYASAGSDPGRGSVLLRSLPMVALVCACTWLVQAQGLLWGQIAATDPDRWPASAWAIARAVQYAAIDEHGYGLILPIPAIVVFAMLVGVLQVLYLDRLAIKVGPPVER